MTTLFAKTKEARKLYDEYDELSQGWEYAWWEKSERIYNLRFKKLYKYVFGTDESDIVKSFKEFCEQIDLPPTTAYYMSNTYKKWVVEMGYAKSDLVNYVRLKLSRAALPKYKIEKKDAENVLAHARPVSKGGIAFSPQSGRYDFVEFLEENFVL